MASRIAGITVEIGGNVGPLSKALESVNKVIKINCLCVTSICYYFYSIE